MLICQLLQQLENYKVKKGQENRKTYYFFILMKSIRDRYQNKSSPYPKKKKSEHPFKNYVWTYLTKIYGLKINCITSFVGSLLKISLKIGDSYKNS